MKEDVMNKISKDYNIYWDAALYCIERDLYNFELPTNFLENIFILRRVTITDRIIDDNEYSYYKIDYRTFFDIKYRENIITKKIDPRLINRNCR